MVLSFFFYYKDIFLKQTFSRPKDCLPHFQLVHTECVFHVLPGVIGNEAEAHLVICGLAVECGLVSCSSGEAADSSYLIAGLQDERLWAVM